MDFRAKRFKFGTVALAIQFVFILLYAFLGEYSELADPKRLPVGKDLNHDLIKFYPRKYCCISCINRLFAYCKGGILNIHIWAWFGYFIC